MDETVDVEITISNTQKKNCLDTYKYNTNCYSEEEFEEQIANDLIAEAHVAAINAEMEDFN